MRATHHNYSVFYHEQTNPDARHPGMQKTDILAVVMSRDRRAMSILDIGYWLD